VLDKWLLTRSYIVGYGSPPSDPTSNTPSSTNANRRYTPSQADVTTFKALSSAPDATKYPNAARWYKHIASYEDEFPTLSGDATKPYTAYGPEVAEVTLNPAKAPAAAAPAAAEDDDDVDLFGSDDDEEEDADAVKLREERLAEYRKKKEGGKPKPAAKSVVTLDVKPWGMLCSCCTWARLLWIGQLPYSCIYANSTSQTTRPT
jgi:elongation factor 1-beta